MEKCLKQVNRATKFSKNVKSSSKRCSSDESKCLSSKNKNDNLRSAQYITKKSKLNIRVNRNCSVDISERNSCSCEICESDLSLYESSNSNNSLDSKNNSPNISEEIKITSKSNKFLDTQCKTNLKAKVRGSQDCTLNISKRNSCSFENVESDISLYESSNSNNLHDLTNSIPNKIEKINISNKSLVTRKLNANEYAEKSIESNSNARNKYSQRTLHIKNQGRPIFETENKDLELISHRKTVKSTMCFNSKIKSNKENKYLRTTKMEVDQNQTKFRVVASSHDSFLQLCTDSISFVKPSLLSLEDSMENISKDSCKIKYNEDPKSLQKTSFENNSVITITTNLRFRTTIPVIQKTTTINTGYNNFESTLNFIKWKPTLTSVNFMDSALIDITLSKVIRSSSDIIPEKLYYSQKANNNRLYFYSTTKISQSSNQTVLGYNQRKSKSSVDLNFGMQLKQVKRNYAPIRKNVHNVVICAIDSSYLEQRGDECVKNSHEMDSYYKLNFNTKFVFHSTPFQENMSLNSKISVCANIENKQSNEYHGTKVVFENNLYSVPNISYDKTANEKKIICNQNKANIKFSFLSLQDEKEDVFFQEKYCNSLVKTLNNFKNIDLNLFAFSKTSLQFELQKRIERRKVQCDSYSEVKLMHSLHKRTNKKNRVFEKSYNQAEKYRWKIYSFSDMTISYNDGSNHRFSFYPPRNANRENTTHFNKASRRSSLILVAVNASMQDALDNVSTNHLVTLNIEPTNCRSEFGMNLKKLSNVKSVEKFNYNCNSILNVKNKLTAKQKIKLSKETSKIEYSLNLFESDQVLVSHNNHSAAKIVKIISQDYFRNKYCNCFASSNEFKSLDLVSFKINDENNSAQLLKLNPPRNSLKIVDDMLLHAVGTNKHELPSSCCSLIMYSIYKPSNIAAKHFKENRSKKSTNVQYKNFYKPSSHSLILFCKTKSKICNSAVTSDSGECFDAQHINRKIFHVKKDAIQSAIYEICLNTALSKLDVKRLLSKELVIFKYVSDVNINEKYKTIDPEIQSSDVTHLVVNKILKTNDDIQNNESKSLRTFVITSSKDSSRDKNVAGKNTCIRMSREKDAEKQNKSHSKIQLTGEISSDSIFNERYFVNTSKSMVPSSSAIISPHIAKIGNVSLDEASELFLNVTMETTVL